MTTTVIVHNAHTAVTVTTYDRVYDHEHGKMTDDWRKVDSHVVIQGQLYTTYCTNTRRLEIVEE
jgi:hypothetical protein